MKNNIVIIGMGEMGGVFARGFLKSGHPVIPVIRNMDMNALVTQIDTPELVLVAVAENDLQSTLGDLPKAWCVNTVLLQNELLPGDWAKHNLNEPTVISVWFEKKKGQDYKVLIPSPAYGPKADLLQSSLQSIDIPCRTLINEAELLHELVLKNVYIITTNVAGLITGGTVSELWSKHETLARTVANDVIDIQEQLTGKTLDRDLLIKDMLIAFNGDPDHNCMGRSAPARLQRAIDIADNAGLAIKKIREIASSIK